MSKALSKQEYAIDIYKRLGVVDLDINKDCYDAVDFSDALMVGDKCTDCEFCISEPVYIIDGMVGMKAGDRNYCEKGYWGEDV